MLQRLRCLSNRNGTREEVPRNGTREEVPDMLQCKQLQNKKLSPKNAYEGLIKNSLIILNDYICHVHQFSYAMKTKMNIKRVYMLHALKEAQNRNC